MPGGDAAARVIRDQRSEPAADAVPGPGQRLRQWLAGPVGAIPLDLFRILVGLLSLAYFGRTLLEAPDYSGPQGLIDHELSLAVFPFTRMGLFQPGMPLVVFQAAFALACIASLAVVAGWRVRVSAAVLYVIAVSTYRWNFLVVYVDDTVMHLLLFWLLLLPLGRTLVLAEWLSQRTEAWRRWQTITVPGAAVRCFLGNVALIYLVAGLWKWTSPMWRDGTALYAVLKMPIAWTPDFWSARHLPLLKVLNWAALGLETIFPVLFFLPRGHRARFALLVALLAFHCGMLLTLQIPFANLACMASMVVLFGEELTSWLRRRSPGAPVQRATPSIGLSGAIAVALVITLTLAMLSSTVLPEWRMPVRQKAVPAIDDAALDGMGSLQMTFFAPLWMAGLVQQYQLFNWIDERNYSVRYDAFDHAGAHRIDPAAIFLPTTRGSLLQAYVHGISWMQIPSHRREQLRKSIYIRSAGRYCREAGGTSDVAVYSTLRRTAAAHPGGGDGERTFLMRFRCGGGVPLMQAVNLSP